LLQCWVYNNERPHSSIGGAPPRKLFEAIQITEILFLASVRNGRITEEFYMNCLICKTNMEYFFSKSYNVEPYAHMMKGISKVDYYKCSNCGFSISKTHKELDQARFEKLNYDFHHYLENNDSNANQPPYLEQATMLKVLTENRIISMNSAIDFAGGYGTLSKTLDKYFNISLAVYDPYVKSEDFTNYVAKKDLTTYKTVFSSAFFEHMLKRENLDDINALVSKTGGAMIIHTVICENIPKDPDWFYIEPPVHTTFHTNKSMRILMEQWGYEACIYCLSAKSWILLKDSNREIEEKIKKINQEFQTEYLTYKEDFIDYWKGF
jgi:hypothetical protein